MLEIIIPLVVVLGSASTLFIRPIREAFDDMLWELFSGPKRFVWGLMYIYTGRKNPELEEKRIAQRETASMMARAERYHAFAEVKRVADKAIEAKSLARVAEIREWQEEFIRLEDPELYAKHIARYKKLNYPKPAQDPRWPIGPGQVLVVDDPEKVREIQRRLNLAADGIPGPKTIAALQRVRQRGETFYLQEVGDRPRTIVVSERRWSDQLRRWATYKRWSDGAESWE